MLSTSYNCSTRNSSPRNLDQTCWVGQSGFETTSDRGGSGECTDSNTYETMMDALNMVVMPDDKNHGLL